MNTSTQIYSRVLRLFPVVVLKEHFQKAKKSQDALIEEILQNASRADIQQFISKNISYTRQHLYIYDFKRPSRFAPEFYPQDYHCGNTTVSGFTVDSFLLPITSTVVELNHMRRSEIKNFWPVSIWVGKKHVVISLTILERYLRYFNDKDITVIGQSVTEEQILNDILGVFRTSGAALTATDTQKGIKDLMNADVLDLRQVTSKNSRSVRSETMDKGYTMKSTYPKEFAELMIRPLETAVFRFVSDFAQVEDFPDKFTCEPQAGVMKVIKYPPKLDSVAETINLILSKN